MALPIWIPIALGQWLVQEVAGNGPITGAIAQSLTNQSKSKNTKLQSIISKINRLAEQIVYEIERSNSIRTPSTQSEITFDKLRETALQKFKQEIYSIQKEIDAVQTWGNNELDRASSETAWDKIGTHANRQNAYNIATNKVVESQGEINRHAQNYNDYLQKQAAKTSDAIQGIKTTNAFNKN